MQAQDRQEKERADARNALEEYVYELRGKLSEGEALHDFIAEDNRNRLVNQLDALEQWLYDEGEDQHRQVRFKKRHLFLNKNSFVEFVIISTLDRRLKDRIKSFTIIVL